MIDGACLATLHATLASSAKLETEALADLGKAGVRIENWPEPVLASLRSAWTEVAKEEGDQDYFFKTVLDDIEKFRAKKDGVSGPSTVQPATVAAPNASAEPSASAETKATP